MARWNRSFRFGEKTFRLITQRIEKNAISLARANFSSRAIGGKLNPHAKFTFKRDKT